MKKFGMVVKISNPKAVKIAGEIAAWLTGKGVECYGEETLATVVDNIKSIDHDELGSKIDAMLVLGGDGTMLLGARLLDGRRIPILGVNLGSLGFLTSIDAPEVYGVLEKMLSGECDCDYEERMTLLVEVTRGGKKVFERTVLNDAVIKGTVARLVKLETRINKEYVTTYRADGLIVATPTGSTAYALSASGPILYPTIHSIILVPICPFTLTNRPVVVPDWMHIEVGLVAGQTGVELTVDGQFDFPLKDWDHIDIKRGETNVYLVTCEGRSYFDILRERLMWEVPGEQGSGQGKRTDRF